MERFSHDNCANCGAMCCRHLIMTIAAPVTKKDIESLKWQLHFEAVKIFIQDKQWHMLVESKCRYLGADERCTQYAKRPKICRKHKPPRCEYHGFFYDTIFSFPQDLEKFFADQKYPQNT